MNSKTIANGIQTLTGIAILIGLALVVLELRQSRELARAQLAADGWAEGMALDRSQLSENFAVTRTKACLTPNELTDSELLEMQAYNSHVMGSLRRRRGYEHIGDYNELSWARAKEDQIGQWLSTKVGRADYAVQRDRLPIWITDVADSLLETGNITSCQEGYLGQYLKLAHSENDPLL